MAVGRALGAVAAWSVRHARAALVVAAVIAVAAAAAATQVETDAGVGTLVDSGNATYQATQRVRGEFGEEPVVVLVKGELPKLILGRNIFRLLRLEGCISGKIPKGAKPLPGPCKELAETQPVEFVSGPATFLNEAVVQIDAQLEKLSKTVAPAQFQQFLLDVATKYGITSAPSIDNEEFVATVVFDLARARGTPKARLSYLFPNAHSAQIVVRLKPDLSEAQRRRAISLIEAATEETAPRKACAEDEKAAPCFALNGGEYVVSGAPVVLDAVSHALKNALLVLFAVALAVMALVLALGFRSRLPLLPLALALGAAAVVFGGLELVGGSLTMASIAVLPILIGLAVDYAIQFQARLDEELGNAGAGGGGADREATAEAARRAAMAGGPTIAAACLATGAGFLVLLLSPTPMVRGFGLLLVAGVLVAFGLVLSAGFAAMALRRGGGPGATGRALGGLPRLRAPLLGPSLSRPALVLAVGVVLAIAGWALGTQIETVTEVRQLAPQGLRAIKDLTDVQESTGVAGQLEVSVEAPELADPATIEWMAAFKGRALKANGFAGEDPSCLEAEICPGPALSDFLVRPGGGKVTQAGVEATLSALSSYSLRQVAPLDPATGKIGNLALVSFGLRSQSLADEKRVIDRVRAAIGEPGAKGGPPAGVEVHLAGLPTIAAEAAAEVSASRYWLALAGLAAVALVLLLVYRSFVRALVPLLPTVLATGWASLLIWATGIPLNPMSAALGALTIAIATEFAVILAGRFREERERGAAAIAAGLPAPAGSAVEVALRRAYSRTGAAVAASAATAVAGFAVLIASDVRMLRDFGAVTVIDLAAALVGVIVILPATLVLIERRRERGAGAAAAPAPEAAEALR